MGCGSSAEVEDAISGLKSEEVGVASVDSFVGSSNELVESFSSIKKALDKKKYAIAKSLDFKKETPIKNIITGLILEYYGVATDIKHIEIKFKFESMDPMEWFEVSIRDMTIDKAKEQVGFVKDFLKGLFESIKEKFPALLSKAEELVEQAKNLKDNAQSEFEALDTMAQMTAVAKTAKVVGTAPKIVKEIKETLVGLKKELDELKELAQEFAKGNSVFYENSKKCVEKNVVGAENMYNFVYPQPKGAKPYKDLKEPKDAGAGDSGADDA